MVKSALVQEQVDLSTYLTSLTKKYPSLTVALAEQPFDELQKVCDALAASDIQAGYEQTKIDLIESKARFAYIWALAELCQTGDYSERGQLLTVFAELTIDLALRAAWVEVAASNKSVQLALDQNPEGMPGLFIFGMGKLGGGDLNFSSDIDLVAFFEPELLPVPEMLGKSYICHLVLQQLTRLLGQKGRPDFIWRVDWRLRPNSSGTSLAMSCDLAEEYYFFRASPWHRLALMKARVVAGDRTAGQAFLNTITPFIWRQNLDFRALDELAEIKNRINLEHPTLRVERQWREPINDDIGGFNVKLGSGGIREIEFIANAMQLVWGGKRYTLRTPNTLQAIRELQKLNQLEEALSEDLTRSYKLLRRIENAIQIVGNQQTHLIPIQSGSQQNLLVLLGVEDWASLVETLNRHRTVVSQYFEALFAEQSDTIDASIEWPESLSVSALEIVEAWEKGFRRYGVSKEMRHRLKPLTKALADYFKNAEKNVSSTFDASATVLRLNDFFRSLPQGGGQYFRLLAESPRLLDSIIPPLLYSPAMSTLLKQSPHIVDCYMENSHFATTFASTEGFADASKAEFEADEPTAGKFSFDSEYVLQAEQYEIRLERMRRFVNEQLYQIYLLFLQGHLGAQAFQVALSDLAVHTIELALEVVAQKLNLTSSPITVIGMGKLALRRMSPLSDLDLIFIFDQDQISLELASKYVSRLQTAIATPMREGIVYELDTRLRPSGRSGAPTVSINSFAAHQLQRAHSWEHIALVPSGVVAGDLSLQPRIEQIKRQVIMTPRDQQQFLQDAAKMWARISQHRVKEFASDVMFSKLRPGGLMQAEYLAACFILHQPIATELLDFDVLLAARIASDSNLAQLPEILKFWRIQQLWERLLGSSGQSLESLPDEYLGRLLSQSGVDSLPKLLAKKQLYADQIVGLMDQFFTELVACDFQPDNWQETKVDWLT